ncbi:acetylornithine aminotransferase [Haloactinospora alba]|uniref:Acetylornithine aminotransferase n=1 Tax=Haloactinospora alba TaxID=405555 RepID=A0A543NHG2_9ACTN|nr:acetylornithine transaminase [Haloactinospora alba]TQN31282.1 acetylornithine aminotransferase [Haloactinospora alba]
MSATAELRERFRSALMPTYGTPPVAIARGDGCRVTDVDGNHYLDLIAGIAVSALGHAHPALVRAVRDQVAAVAHTSNLFVHEPGVELAERLIRLVRDPGAGVTGAAPDTDVRVFFGNSGSEANEAALKLVRLAAGPSRDYVVSTESGFHGRTSGALAVTGKPAIRDKFGPFTTDVRFVPYGDPAALRAAVDDSCAAVFVEPTQGEAGVVQPPSGYLHAVREVCDNSGAAFVLDEVQSGVGRTGHWFAHQADGGAVPDILTLAKGLGGGLPIGACLGFGDYATAFAKGDHGTTFGGNPVAASAALAVLDTIESEGLLANAAETGALLAERVAAVDDPLLAGIHGTGLWRGIRLTRPVAADVQEHAAAHGFLVNAVTPDTLRIAPPLTISAEEILEFTEALPSILAESRPQEEGTAP